MGKEYFDEENFDKKDSDEESFDSEYSDEENFDNEYSDEENFDKEYSDEENFDEGNSDEENLDEENSDEENFDKEDSDEENFDNEYSDEENFDEQYSDEENFDEGNSDEENLDEENSDEENFDKEYSDEENFDKEYSDEEYFDKEYSDEENFDKEYSDEENFNEENYYEYSDQENFDEENLDEENSDEENFDEENLDEENSDEENFDEENSDEENLDEENFDEKYFNGENFYKEYFNGNKFDIELAELIIAIRKKDEVSGTGEDSSNNEFESGDSHMCNFFDCLDVQLSDILFTYGFVKPTPLQYRAIGPIIQGRDVVLHKDRDVHTTATFSIPIVQLVDAEINKTQVLVLSPTKRKALLNDRVISALGNFMGVRSYAFIDYDDILEMPNEGLHVVNGTPKTILGMIAGCYLKTESIQMVVIDECDEIFKRGLKKKLYNICKFLHPNTQIVIVSANLDKETIRFPKKLGIDRRSMKTLLISDNESTELYATQNSVKNIYM
ncbi:hypothetical protein TKK_0009221 [Trichogramma kaykai]